MPGYDAPASWTVLEPYVPRLVTDWLTQESLRLARELDATLVVIDISGFTSLAERLARHGRVGAEEVTDVIDGVFTRLLGVAHADQGEPLKFAGDALMLLFTGRDHAARACRAAIGMRATLRALGRVTTAAGEVVLRMSVGVHTGPVHAFLVGGSHRELVVAGPGATAVTARQSSAEADEILISVSTAAAVDPRARGAARGEAYVLRRSPVASLRLDAVPALRQDALDIGMAVPVAVRRHLLAGGGQPEHRTATVAFVRFGGFDTLLETAGLDAAGAQLDRLTKLVQDATDAHGITFQGTDVCRDGGNYYLVAGAPEATGSDEERLLRTVRAIVDEGGDQLVLRAGVNHGPVFSGSLGMPLLRTYAVMGDTVNVAARLTQAAAPGTVLSTAGPLDRSRTRFSSSGPQQLSVKGKSTMIEAFEVGSLTGTAELATRRLPFVGRHPELAILRAALGEAVEGRGSVVDVVGEPGSGKSRLLDEAVTAVEGVRTMRVRGDQYEVATAFRAARSLLLDVLGLSVGADADTVAGALTESVHASAPELVPWIPLLGVPLDVVVPETAAVANLHPSFRLAQLERVVAQWVAAAVPDPTVWIIEDAHYVDDASTGLLQHLMAQAAERAWLVCIARRENDGGLVRAAGGAVAGPPDGPAVPRLRLGPLHHADAVALATAADDMALPHHQLVELVARAGGNPLFLLELVAAATAGGELPTNVEAAVTTRLDKLTPTDRALLRSSAVLGNSFSVELAEAVLPDGTRCGVENFRALHDFLEEPQPGMFQFRQGIVRDVAYEGLPFRLRHELHARAGAALEGVRDAAPALMALHFARAGDHNRTWRHARVAGDRAAAKSANVEAAGLFQLALAAANHLDGIPALYTAEVAESLGDVCELAGLYKQGARAYRIARQCAPDDLVRQAELFRKEGFIRERSARYVVARRWYRRGLECCSQAAAAGVPGHEAVRRRIAGLYAAALAWEGRYKTCIRWCHDVVADAQAAGDEEALAHAYYLLDWAYTDLGSPESARYRALALPIYERLGDRIGQANVLNNLGADAYYEGRWHEALEYYEHSRQAREEAGDVVQSATATNNIAEVLADQGDLGVAESLFAGALRVFRAAGYQAGIAVATSNLGGVAARTGRPHEAATRLADARERFATIGAHVYMLETDARIAEAHLAARDAAQALALVEDTLNRAEARPGLAALVARLQRLRAEALIALSRTEEAHAWLEHSAQVARATNARHELALTLAVLSDLYRRTGRAPDVAHAAAAESAAIMASLGVRSTADSARQ